MPKVLRRQFNTCNEQEKYVYLRAAMRAKKCSFDTRIASNDCLINRSCILKWLSALSFLHTSVTLVLSRKSKYFVKLNRRPFTHIGREKWTICLILFARRETGLWSSDFLSGERKKKIAQRKASGMHHSAKATPLYMAWNFPRGHHVHHIHPPILHFCSLCIKHQQQE